MIYEWYIEWYKKPKNKIKTKQKLVFTKVPFVLPEAYEAAKLYPAMLFFCLFLPCFFTSLSLHIIFVHVLFLVLCFVLCSSKAGVVNYQWQYCWLLSLFLFTLKTHLRLAFDRKIYKCFNLNLSQQHLHLEEVWRHSS